MQTHTNAQKVNDFVNERTQTGSIEARVQSTVRLAVIQGMNHLAERNHRPDADHREAEAFVKAAATASGLTQLEIWDAAFDAARERGIL